MKYHSIFAHWAFDEIKEGKKVYALDRQTKTVAVVNEMTVDTATALLKSASENSDRYEFWVEEEETENA